MNAYEILDLIRDSRNGDLNAADKLAKFYLNSTTSAQESPVIENQKIDKKFFSYVWGDKKK